MELIPCIHMLGGIAFSNVFQESYGKLATSCDIRGGLWPSFRYRLVIHAPENRRSILSDS
jgi:hypothetical protein